MAKSIGLMINGIALNPMHVGAHFRAKLLTLEFCINFPAVHVIRLITRPGIITDANICHRNTSPAVFTAGFRPPPSNSGF